MMAPRGMAMTMSRRETLVLAGAGVLGAAAAPAMPAGASDDAGWARIAALYALPKGVVQLEHGYWGSMAAPVEAAWHERARRLNRDTAFYARRAMRADLEAVVARAASEMGARPEDVALVRNASEGLSALIGQVQGIGAGDQIIRADIDYDSTKGDMASLAAARGAELVTLAMPRLPSRDGVIAAYAEAFARSPRLKLVLLTQMSNRTGLVVPVAEIAALARARGALVVVDAAQSFFHVPCRMEALGADAVVVNFHKWAGAPIGCAAIWIAPASLKAFAVSPATPDAPADRVASRVYPGTVDFAAWLTIPDAFDFQAGMGGVAAKLPRLRALRDRWVKPLRGLDGLEILTTDDPDSYGAISSFRIRGRTRVADNIAITDALLNRFGIMTVHRIGLADGACVRVTPALATPPSDVDRLVPALRTLVAEMAV